MGLFFAGVGVVPLGMLASAFNDGWGQFWNLLLILVITYATRMYGFWLSEKYEEYEYAKSNQQFENIIEGEIIDNNGSSAVEYPTIIDRNNITLGNDSSILLVGETGTGKSELVHTILGQLKSSYTPEEVSFVLFDLKQTEFQDEDVTYLHKDIITSASAGVRALRELVEYADLRIRKKQKYPAILVYIEEADISVNHQEKFDNLLISLLGKAKAANYCIIYSTSRISSQTVSKKLLIHFEIILASRLPLHASKYLNISDTSNVEKYSFMRFEVPATGSDTLKTSAKVPKEIESNHSDVNNNKASTRSSSAEDDELEDWDKIKERG